MNKREIGSIKEGLALEYLENKGYSLLDKNFRTKHGEVDLIVIKHNVIVFVEVKYRKNINYGYPEEAVNFRKLNTIKQVATIYMSKHKEYIDFNIRFDIISILGDKIKHITNLRW